MLAKIKLLWTGRFSLLKTLYLNFRLFPFKTAVRLPLAVSGRVRIRGCKRGTVLLRGQVKTFMISLGFGGSSDLIPYNPKSSVLQIEPRGRVEFCGRAHFAPHFSLVVKNGGTVTVGNGFSCNNGCKISCVCGITLGDNCLLGGDVVIRDSDGHRIFSRADADTDWVEHASSKPVSIGNHVWICNKSDVLKGVVIGDGCIVSYGSLVVKPLEGDHLLIGGTPARLIKDNIKWER